MREPLPKYDSSLSLSLKGNIQIPFDDAKATHLLPIVDGGEVTVNNVQAAAATVVDELSNVLHGGETARQPAGV